MMVKLAFGSSILSLILMVSISVVVLNHISTQDKQWDKLVDTLNKNNSDIQTILGITNLSDTDKSFAERLNYLEKNISTKTDNKTFTDFKTEIKITTANLTYSKASKSDLEALGTQISTIKSNYVSKNTLQRHTSGFGNIHHSHRYPDHNHNNLWY